MSNVVSCEQFLLRRTAGEQQRVAESMRGLAQAVDHFVEVVDQACAEAKSELEVALKRTGDLQRHGAAERERAKAALDHGGLDILIAERDRLLSDSQQRQTGGPPTE
ncbi:MAG: hypothetical protein H7Z12_02345 [Rhodospirillaceae bacterium]|nr:hypothetical protein [Rhodospirillales bacterium]